MSDTFYGSDYAALQAFDPDIADVLVSELDRLRGGLQLIASENFSSPEVLTALGSTLSNKYAEGYPGRRYYGGCSEVDKAEELTVVVVPTVNVEVVSYKNGEWTLKISASLVTKLTDGVNYVNRSTSAPGSSGSCARIQPYSPVSSVQEKVSRLINVPSPRYKAASICAVSLCGTFAATRTNASRCVCVQNAVRSNRAHTCTGFIACANA